MALIKVQLGYLTLKQNNKCITLKIQIRVSKLISILTSFQKGEITSLIVSRDNKYIIASSHILFGEDGSKIKVFDIEKKIQVLNLPYPHTESNIILIRHSYKLLIKVILIHWLFQGIISILYLVSKTMQFQYSI